MKIPNITLNFQEKYYPFYEWLKDDNIECFNNVVLYKVSSKTINDFIEYKVRLLGIDKSPVIFSDGYSFIALELDEKGNAIYKSSLLLNDEIELTNKCDNLNKTKIEYQKLFMEKRSNDLREYEQIKKTINLELQVIREKHDIEKLEYLYYEWFKKSSNSFSYMLRKMEEKLLLPIGEDEIYIYNLIKKTYKLV